MFSSMWVQDCFWKAEWQWSTSRSHFCLTVAACPLHKEEEDLYKQNKCIAPELMSFQNQYCPSKFLTRDGSSRGRILTDFKCFSSCLPSSLKTKVITFPLLTCLWSSFSQGHASFLWCLQPTKQDLLQTFAGPVPRTFPGPQGRDRAALLCKPTPALG